MQPLKNPGIAAVLSFFWPGVGQIYNGQMTKGLILVGINAICWLLNITLILSIVIILDATNILSGNICLIALIGIPIQVVLGLYAIFDAYNTAVKINKTISQEQEQQQS